VLVHIVVLLRLFLLVPPLLPPSPPPPFLSSTPPLPLSLPRWISSFLVIIILSELITVTIAYNYWFLLNQELFSVLFIGAHIVSLTIMR
jgi:hypothetical protein